MNIAQMMKQKNENKNPMSLKIIQNGFKNLSKKQIEEMVRIAKQQGISDQQINEGLKMIRALR